MATQREMYHGNELYAWRENAANRTRAIDVDKWAQNQADILHLPGAQGEKKLSILDNVISPSSAFVRVDTEGGAPADDLAAITPGDLHVGMLLHLVSADSERVVTLRNSADATGIQTVDGKDVALDTQYGIVLRLVSTEALTYWEEIPGPLRAKKQPVASKDNLGLMQVGDNLDVTAQGVVSVPLAGKDKPGVIQPDGVNLDIISGLLNLSAKLQAELAEQETLRKLSIGCPKFWRSTTLPANHVYPDGSLILFDDWPEFKAVYEAGGFAGMLMPWNADAATQAANLGKYRPNSANPTGLYLPLHGGQFFRNWALGADGEAGAWQTDTGREVSGTFGGFSPTPSGAFTSSNDVRNIGAGNNHSYVLYTMAASLAWGSEHTGTEFTPPHIWQPIILYLGRSAQVEDHRDINAGRHDRG